MTAARTIIILISAALYCVPVAGQNVSSITDKNTVINLAPDALYYEDKTSKLSPTDIAALDTEGVFLHHRENEVNLGISASTFWVKSIVDNKLWKPVYIEITNYGLSDITLYEVRHGVPQPVQHTGSSQRFSQRPVPDVNYLLPLDRRDGLDTFFIKVAHPRGVQFGYYAGCLDAYYVKSATRNLWEGMYYGFMLLMVLYNLFLYFSLRDRMYLLYVAYVFLMGLLNASLNGYAFKYLWPAFPTLNRYEDVISSAVSIAGIFFTMYFLDTKKNAPFFHKLFTVYLWAYVVTIIVVLCGQYMWGTIMVELISLVLVISFFICASRIYKGGFKPARYFLIAWTLLLASIIIFILKDFNILPYNGFTVSSMQIGSAAEAVLLSLALANRINILKQQREEAEEVKDYLTMYVDNDLLKHIGNKAPDTDLLSNDTVEASVLYIDICGFTSISERHSANTVVRMLNYYFDVIVKEIIGHEGSVDKFIGDAVLAVFRGENHLNKAISAALAVHKAIDQLPQTFNELEYLPKVSTGVNSGEVIAGNIGSASLKRLDWTVIGDVVNTAQRLRSVATPGQILLSEALYHKVKGTFTCTRISEVQLKNKQQKMVVYEVNQ